MEIDDQVAREIATFLNEGVAEDGVVSEWIAALTPEPRHDPLCNMTYLRHVDECAMCASFRLARADQDAKRKAQIEQLETVSAGVCEYVRLHELLAVFDAS